MVLFVKEGYYKSDSFFGLVLEVLKHRTWHLIKEGKWKD
jgi:hypothetical protein